MSGQGSQVPRRRFERITGITMNVLRAYFLFPLRVLAFLIGVFRTNRAGVARQLAEKYAAYSLRGVIF